MTPCSICGAPSVGRGWCRKHYLRWYRHADPLTVLPPSPLPRVRPRRFAHRPIENITQLSTPCRVWMGLRNAKGYGLICRAGSQLRVHRHVWQLANGPIPKGLILRHRCDNPPCFRLDHLVLGTVADNQRDMMERGRSTKGRPSGR